MKSISELKNDALSSLNEKWGISIGAILVFFAISMALSLIPIIGGLAQLILTGALSVGLAHFFLKLSKSENVDIEDLFIAFKSKDKFLVSLSTYVLIIIIIVPIILIFGSIWVSLFVGDLNNIFNLFLAAVPDTPSLGATYQIDPSLLKNASSDPIFQSGAGTIFVAAIILIFIPLIIVSLGFSQVFFLIADDKTKSGIEALKTSWNLMNGKKTKLFLLQLSFIGWVILSILTLFIGFIFLYPYIYTTLSKFYKELYD
jgi:uncharacterized membrane protein